MSRNHSLKPAPCLIVASLVWCSSASAAPREGDPAPPIKASMLLQAPDGAAVDPESLAGSLVVLEFWATWCGPCIAAIPHLNELADAFADKPVRFISMTNEDEDVVRPFLERREMRTWVALDDEGATFDAYGVRGIPATFIISPDGVILQQTHPMALSKDAIERALASREMGIPQRATGPGLQAGVLPGESGQSLPLSRFILVPTQDKNGATMTGPAGIAMHGVTPERILQVAFGVDERRLVLEAVLPTGAFHVAVNVPRPARERVYTLMREGVLGAFAVSATREMRVMPVYILTAPNGPGPELVKGDAELGSSVRTGPTGMSISNHTTTTIAAALQAMVDAVIIDETSLAGGYDMALDWSEGDVDAALRTLCEKYGLVLTPAQREVEVVVIRPATE